MGRAALERCVDHIASLPEQPSRGDTDCADVCSALHEAAPEDGRDFESLLDRVFDELVPRSFTTPGPGYLAYVPGGGLFPAAIADLVSNTTNRYIGVWQAAPAPRDPRGRCSRLAARMDGDAERHEWSFDAWCLDLDLDRARDGARAPRRARLSGCGRLRLGSGAPLREQVGAHRRDCIGSRAQGRERRRVSLAPRSSARAHCRRSSARASPVLRGLDRGHDEHGCRGSDRRGGGHLRRRRALAPCRRGVRRLFLRRPGAA